MAMHRYVADVEAILLYYYKVDPYTMEQSMSMIDLQLMVQQLSKNAKEEEDNKKQSLSGHKVAEALAAVRDILNYISLPDSKR